jgi:hypothetical protein
MPYDNEIEIIVNDMSKLLEIYEIMFDSIDNLTDKNNIWLDGIIKLCLTGN